LEIPNNKHLQIYGDLTIPESDTRTKIIAKNYYLTEIDKRITYEVDKKREDLLILYKYEK
jgi:hypothetical protein